MGTNEPQGVSRRAIIQAIGSAPALAAATATTASAQNAARPAYRRKLFDDRQWHTVEVLCDLIIPADERSVSATHAGVPEFIDDWLDFRKREDGNDALASQILGDCRGSTRSPPGSSARISPRPRRPSRSNCWIASPGRRRLPRKIAGGWRSSIAFRDLTVSGFFSSEAGIADLPYLGNKAVAEWKGCDPAVWAIIEKRLAP